MNIIKKLKYIFHNFWRALAKDLAQTIEEFRAIARNQSYASRYPKLFAIFAVIEHEQSPQVFEANQDDFKIIKTDILQNEEINSHQVLEALRGLFQNSNLLDFSNQIKNEIANYLYAETSNMVRVSDRYYAPLIKALLRGFPFLLNHEDYAIFKKLLQQKTTISLRIVKYVLEHEFGSFFIDKSDAIKLLLSARDFNNKAAYMLLLRHVRQNNLLEEFFDADKNHFKNKIGNGDLINKFGLDYAIVTLSYLEDKYFESKKIQNEALAIVKEICAHHLGVKKQERKKNYSAFHQAIIRSQRLGYKNKIIATMFEESAQFMNKDKKASGKKLAKILSKTFSKLNKNKPSTTMRPQGFFAVSPFAVEEYWLLENASYLL